MRQILSEMKSPKYKDYLLDSGTKDGFELRGNNIAGETLKAS